MLHPPSRGCYLQTPRNTPLTGPKLVIKDVAVTLHNATNVCYTFTVGNVGVGPPEGGTYSRQIEFAGSVTVREGTKIGATFDAGVQRGHSANLQLVVEGSNSVANGGAFPERLNDFKGGTTYSTAEQYCSPLTGSDGTRIANYDVLLADGALFFRLEMSGYAGWAESTSESIKLSAPTPPPLPLVGWSNFAAFQTFCARPTTLLIEQLAHQQGCP